MILALDISRNKSGGAISYYKGILNNIDVNQIKFDIIYIFGEKKLLSEINENPHLLKINSSFLENGILLKLFWQKFLLPKRLKKLGVNLLYSSDASTLAKYSKLVVLSQDLLPYEQGVLSSYTFGLAKLRGYIIRFVQNKAFKRSDSIIFLTDYSKEIIFNTLKIKRSHTIIPHGIDPIFKDKLNQKSNYEFSTNIDLVYVSNTEFYKNHWHVLKAVKTLIDEGFNVRITFIGGGEKKSYNLLLEYIKRYDPNFEYTRTYQFLDRPKLISILKSSDIAIFASSCENLPITLLEYMALGLPIACSRVGPMPSILADAGLYFDPLEYKSISCAIKSLIKSKKLRTDLGQKAIRLSENYSWRECSNKTFDFLLSMVHK